MSVKNSDLGDSEPVRSQDVRRPSAADRAAGQRRRPAAAGRDAAGGPRASRTVDVGGQTLDATDRAILEVLAADGRIANNTLAEQVGIAASTCLTRVRALREAGVIRGVHADIDPAAVGLPLQAMIAVRVQAGSRDHLMDFAERIRRRPEVRSVYFLAGADDFLVHVAAADSAALRSFVVDQLSAHQQVALTETNLIFEHLRGAGLPD